MNDTQDNTHQPETSISDQPTPTVPQDCYREKYVAFIDMLGFGQRIKASADNYDDRREIISAINELRKSISNNDAIDLVLTYFSDCVVISTQSDPDGLRTLFLATSYIASNLVQRDVLIRGGIAHGGIYHDDDLCFGPAMVRAYEIESKEAVHPCVMLDREVYNDAVIFGLDAEWLITDGKLNPQHILHHLIEIQRKHISDYKRESPELFPPARLARHAIANAMNSGAHSVRKKGEWMRNYWDTYVIQDCELPAIDLERDSKKPRLVPSSTRLLNFDEFKEIHRRQTGR